MVLRALGTGVSGLLAEGEAISVNADNIANVNTVGFKRQRATFEDQLGRSILAGAGLAQPGAGVRVADVQVMHTQGTLSNTGISTDLALSGDGFFVVSGTQGGLTSDFYTRNGQFNLDSDGFLVNTQGLRVQGYAATPDGRFEAALTDVQVPTSAIPPRVSETLRVVANLDANDPVPAAAWDPQDPSSTANFSTTITVYDSLGASHSMDVYFRKTAPNSFDYYVLASGDETVPTAAGLNVEVGNGSLSFTTDGALDTVTTTNAVTVDFVGATAGQAIDVDFGSTIAGGGTGLDGLTQFNSPSNVSAQSQDGYSAGEFAGVSVDGEGIVRVVYTNGERLPSSQLGIAKFVSNDGLARAGANLFIATGESGEAAMGTAGTGGRAAVSAGALEASNVDMAEEFVGLIQHQRAYSANSRTITTADAMLQELLAIKR